MIGNRYDASFYEELDNYLIDERIAYLLQQHHQFRRVTIVFRISPDHANYMKQGSEQRLTLSEIGVF